jgi:hypothetical protein
VKMEGISPVIVCRGVLIVKGGKSASESGQALIKPVIPGIGSEELLDPRPQTRGSGI